MNYKLLAYAEDFASFLLQNMNSDGDKIKQIILFGSVARGDAGKNSDVDLFIDVLDPSIEKKVKKITADFYESVKAKKYWNFFGVKNEINCTVGRIEEWPDLERSFISQGLVLYGKYKGKVKMSPYFLFILAQSINRNKNIALWRKLYGYRQKVEGKLYQKSGLVKDYEGEKVAKGVFIIPAEHTQKMISFLKKNKIKYKIISFWKD